MGLHDTSPRARRSPYQRLLRNSAVLTGAGVLLSAAVVLAALPVARHLMQPATLSQSAEASVAPLFVNALPPLRPVLFEADGAAILPAGTAMPPVLMQARSGPLGLAAPHGENAPPPGFAGLPLAPAEEVYSDMGIVIQVPTATTPRPQRRELADAQSSSLPRPLPRPDFAMADDTPRPLPRPALAQASLAAAAIAEAESMSDAAAVITLAGFAPLTSPQPVARPAQAVAAAQRLAAADAAQPANPAQAVAAAETVAPSTLARVFASSDCSSQLTRAIPRRSRNARTGSEITAALGNSNGGGTRDQLIASELLAGNMPSFLRALTPVTMTGQTSAGRQVQITVCVTPDYLALGDDADFIRVPMGLPEAAKIADKLGFMLPTTRIVDAIYAQAGLRLAPRPMQAGPQMSSTGYFRQHNATIDGQTSSTGFHRGELIAGTKKDLVLSNRLRSAPGQVAIYGWHQPNGRPIQPLSTVHQASYSDYSHGVRLVSQTAYLNGKAVALADLLEDPVYAWVISTEGPIPASRTLLASLYTN
ncbi:MAG: hypothetical protein Q8O82_06155 [Pseudorhodobacter sp.]|nr:hypothetical protein [Pseudorhodobacter sp.]